jgi:tetratricopeptide (TPR) repeat protein
MEPGTFIFVLMRHSPVRFRRQQVVLPTYVPQPPDKNPMFLEKRVYQGSSGRIYPLPFYNRIADEPTEQSWDAIFLENEYVEVMILPQIGGRIHAARDKTNGYDFFYRQDVIKPALVGLAGPWISGGVEFNWPQHHRPATFMPVDTEIERHPDGSVTVWCSDHDPLQRMKGMHGVCLHPGRSVVEVKVRAHNRTDVTQTFLWWANVATRVHEAYQSFFPPDVHYVADHARRSMSTYPLCSGSYYGVDYAGRAKNGVPPSEAPSNYVPPASGGKTPVPYAANDLSFYANIPVPTSYMCMGSEEDFFGGYDHSLRAGVVHVANHHISPGKKQWTWGNHEFGYAWDRSLTDAAAEGEYPPYIEIMAGVYTDNQPDFSFLQPGETKSWSQFWYPIREIGPATHANVEASLSLALERGTLRVGVAVSRPFRGAEVRVECRGKLFKKFRCDLAPDTPFARVIAGVSRGVENHEIRLSVTAKDGREIIAWSPSKKVAKEVPPPATEPPSPETIASCDELYITGLHLDQYRHATRSPEPYWLEAVRRDPGDARCNTALGIRHYHRGEFTLAEGRLRTAIARLTLRNANPADGEALYYLGLTLLHLGREKEAYASLYKAVWNLAWQAPGYHALARIDCRRGDWASALDHLDRSLAMNADNLSARNLRVMVLRESGRTAEAEAALNATRALDPLDWWSRHLAGKPLSCDTQTVIDLVLDLMAAGFNREAYGILSGIVPDPDPDPGTAPLVGYYLGWIEERAGHDRSAAKYRAKAAKASPDYCFPARLEEIAILESAIRADSRDARAPYYLGNLFYDRRRHREAIQLWEKSAALDPSFPVVWRNLGIGYQNILGDSAKARRAYGRAFAANPADARLLYERDQLWKRTGEAPEKRLRELSKHPDLVSQRDDLAVEVCSLHNQTGHPAKAREILLRRRFQPWEGGEGQALGQFVRAGLALGRVALRRGDAAAARDYFTETLTPPRNLCESKHLLANQSDIHYWLGVAFDHLGEKAAARRHWKAAAEFRGDFQEMSVRAFSEMTYYSAMALQRLGRQKQGNALLRGLLAYAMELGKSEAKIDYFATSLPTMLLFEDDLGKRQKITALFLTAQAELGLGNKAKGATLLREILRRDPNHPFASDLMKDMNPSTRS